MRFYLRVLEKYAEFNGRASRKEYVYFTLFNIVFIAAAVIFDNLAGTVFTGLPFGYLTVSYFVAMSIPSTAVQVRRRHDIGLSGWDFLNHGGFRMWRAGDVGENKYGPDPRAFD